MAEFSAKFLTVDPSTAAPGELSLSRLGLIVASLYLIVSDRLVVGDPLLLCAIMVGEGCVGEGCAMSLSLWVHRRRKKRDCLVK